MGNYTLRYDYEDEVFVVYDRTDGSKVFYTRDRDEATDWITATVYEQEIDTYNNLG